MAVDRNNRWWPLIVFGLALAAALIQSPRPEPAVFSAPPLTQQQTGEAIEQALPQLAELPYTPASPTLTRWANGRHALAWLGPSLQDSQEVAIWFANQNRHGQWQTPLEIASRATAAGGSFALVSRISSPVLYAEGSWLHLWHIGHALGGWGGAALYQSTSTDGGKSWTLARRLPLTAGPGFGAYSLHPPVGLADGGVLLPLARGVQTPTHGLRFSATGRLIDRLPLDTNDPLFSGATDKPQEIPQ